jgi:hypothetical protein
MNSTQTQVSAAVAPIVAQVPASSVQQVTQAAGFPSVKYVLIGRPARGNALFAHTAAAFEALGLFRGESVSRQTMLRVWGDTALKYHADKFERTESGYALNDEGFSKFGEWRTVDPEMAAVFFSMLTTGKGGENLPQSYQGVKPL